MYRQVLSIGETFSNLIMLGEEYPVQIRPIADTDTHIVWDVQPYPQSRVEVQLNPAGSYGHHLHLEVEGHDCKIYATRRSASQVHVAIAAPLQVRLRLVRRLADGLGMWSKKHDRRKP